MGDHGVTRDIYSHLEKKVYFFLGQFNNLELGIRSTCSFLQLHTYIASYIYLPFLHITMFVSNPIDV